jgi:hypothetical protein
MRGTVVILTDPALVLFPLSTHSEITGSTYGYRKFPRQAPTYHISRGFNVAASTQTYGKIYPG